jgi:hypothetical protein
MEGISFSQLRVLVNAGRAFDDYRVEIEKAVKNDPRACFGYVDLKKKRVNYAFQRSFGIWP